MEELHARADELGRVATSCGLDKKAALDDIADSMEIANKLGSPSSRDDIREFFSRWWVAFMNLYFLKCLKRWQAQCGNSRDYQSMQKLWLESFEPLLVVGCNFAKDIQRNNIKKGLVPLFLAGHPERHTKADEESLQGWLDDFLGKLDEGFVKGITIFKENQRQVIAKSLKDLAEYDKVSPLGKLKRLIFR